MSSDHARGPGGIRRSYPARMVAGILIFILLIGGLGGVTLLKLRASDTATGGSPTEAETLGRLVDVALEQGELVLACPPGIIDPATAQPRESEPQLWETAGITAEPLQGGGSALKVPAQDLQSDSYAAATLSAEPQGDLASFILESCAIPSRDVVLSAGATEIGDDTVLVLSNPGIKSVEVQVQVMTAIGPALDQPATITVAAGSTVSVLPAVWASGESRIAVRVQADGMGVASWLQTSRLDGELPLGLSRVPGVVPATESVLVGLDTQSAKTLRVANAGTEPGSIEITAYGEDGPVILGGTEDLEVEAMGVFDVDLAGLPAGTRALKVTSNVPIVSSVLEQSDGGVFAASPDLNVGIRNLLSSADSLDSAMFPTQSALGALTEKLGLVNIRGELVLANVGSQTVIVTLGESEIEVPAESTQSVDLSKIGSETAASLTSSSPIFAALRVTVEAPAGNLTSAMDLRQDVANTVNRQVDVFPSHG
ncbi:DUF5719 family protein [Actinomycetaceae bacterium MB13-C1-2]|nr:DUF5719 family protein [Actinomycetaceae bacterium MB13-C1-2]